MFEVIVFLAAALRAHFKDAHDAWKELGPLSDLYVIIIDEIDAICKPRGEAGGLSWLLRTQMWIL